MPERKTVIVIGGGASGLMAAIIAARNGADVKILEQMNRVGKKILATGNGRCNLTNENIVLERYHGKNPQFAIEVLKGFDVLKTIDFFEKLGISCKVEDGGKVYPASDQASSVLDVLRYELLSLGVPEICESGVKSIHKDKKDFTIILRSGEQLRCDRVILAAGGKASPSLGSNGSGYNLAIPFGHRLVEPIPALVQLKLDKPFLKGIKGVRLIVKASIGVNEILLRDEYGEVLFTDYGISGPAVFQLSRRAGEEIQKLNTPWIKIDMFPQRIFQEFIDMLNTRFSNQPEKPLDFSFIGLLNKRLINVVLKEAKIEDIHKPCGKTTTEERKNIADILKQWKMDIIGTQSWSEAQVTAGGIDVNDVNPKTMESKLVTGLYFSGEILDIDGDCGGFNLQWAWSSGYTAGTHAATD